MNLNGIHRCKNSIKFYNGGYFKLSIDNHLHRLKVDHSKRRRNETHGYSLIFNSSSLLLRRESAKVTEVAQADKPAAEQSADETTADDNNSDTQDAE